MEEKQIVKGNEAIALAALDAKMDAFFGYPITPSSEVPETLAKYYPERLKVYLQAESEVAAVNMMLGASSCGARVMTATSSPGFSLMQEGLSYIAGSFLPSVFINITRAGPGLGNIAGEQSDYFQMTKSGGHGGNRSIVLAPSSVQEMYDFTIKAFDLADKYRIPVIVTADGYLGQMKEAIVMSKPEIKKYDKSEWATTGAKNRGPHVITSIEIEHDDMEMHRYKLVQLYKKVMENEILFEEYKTEDAEVIFVAYGIVSRIVKDVINMAREKGIKVGLIRPKTLWPFPSDKITELAGKAKSLFVIELSPGQMVEDVERATLGKCPVYFYGRCGGNMPSKKEIFEKLETNVLGALK